MYKVIRWKSSNLSRATMMRAFPKHRARCVHRRCNGMCCSISRSSISQSAWVRRSVSQSIPISYFLKDNLHLSPVRMAIFLAIVSIPVCFGFVFGFIRDRWRTARWGDRHYLLVCAVGAAATYLWIATSTIDYMKLLSLVFIVIVLYVMIFAAAQALMTGVAQSHGMTGRLSVVFGFGFFTPAVLSAPGWRMAGCARFRARHVPDRRRRDAGDCAAGFLAARSGERIRE